MNYIKNKLFFKKCYVEITNICNRSCSFCPEISRSPAFMEMPLFEKILNELKGYTRHLCFHVMGEPLLHPELTEFLGKCKTQDYQVNLTTNGMLIQQNSVELLKQPALRMVNFSLHCLEDNTPVDHIDKYIKEIFDFIEQARIQQPSLIVCLRLWNLQSVTSNTHAYLLKKIEDFLSLPYRLQAVSSQGNGIKLAENLYINQAMPFAWPNLNKEEKTTRGFCLGLRNQMAILVDGTVVPCCLDSEGTINLGNIYNQSLQTILSSQRAQALYQNFSQKKVSEILCQTCTYRNRFNKIVAA